MREIASPLDGFASPFGGGRRADPIAVFNSWFLSSGTWDSAKRWIDAALWEPFVPEYPEWFLRRGHGTAARSGSIPPFGMASGF
jgi:hypothetical protein